jgi:septal ring factor EnvC (AmiA/AmiB activator)
MSFFKKVIGNFVHLEDDKTAPKQTEAKQTQVETTEVPSESFNFDGAGVPAGLVNTQITATQGAFNQEFYDHLQNEIANNDQEGADYFEFKKVYEAMKKSIPNEAAALSAAFNALKATSPDLTVEKLIETADVYLSVVNKEDVDFMNQYEGEFQTEVIGRQEAIENELATQEELQKKLAESQAKVQTLQTEKVQEESKLASVKANWDVTKQLVVANIETDKKNILNFLQTQQA